MTSDLAEIHAKTNGQTTRKLIASAKEHWRIEVSLFEVSKLLTFTTHVSYSVNTPVAESDRRTDHWPHQASPVKGGIVLVSP